MPCYNAGIHLCGIYLVKKELISLPGQTFSVQSHVCPSHVLQLIVKNETTTNFKFIYFIALI